MRVLAATGGTAGHLSPALAVADSLRSRGCEVVFAGARGRADERIVPARGYELHTFPISSLPRRPGVAQVRAVWRALVAVPRCMAIIRRTRPDVLLAGGGFVCAPAAVAAWLMRVPVVVTEADAHLGLANRIAARVARRLCTGYPLPQHRLRQTVTGRPVSDAFLDVDKAAARAQWGVADGDVVLVVVGGSGGATHLSEAAYGAFGADARLEVGGAGRVDTAGHEHPGRMLHVLHVTGHRDYGDFAKRGVANDRYRLIEYCEDMPALFGAADLVVSRSGGSVFELAAVGRAAVLVPLPGAPGDHQTRNAEHYVARGGALLVPDRECTADRLLGLVLELLGPDEDGRRERLAQGMHRLVKPHAASDIAAIVHDIGAAHGRRRQP